MDGFIDPDDLTDDFIHIEASKQNLDLIQDIYDLRTNSASFWAPVQLNAEVDYYIFDNYFLSFVVNRDIPLMRKVHGLDIFSIVPRYESRWFDIALPLSLINDQYVNIGSFFRLGPLTFGTHNIQGLIIPSKFRGASAYIGLQLNADFFDKLAPGISGYNNRVTAPNRKIKCYRF